MNCKNTNCFSKWRAIVPWITITSPWNVENSHLLFIHFGRVRPMFGQVRWIHDLSNLPLAFSRNRSNISPPESRSSWRLPAIVNAPSVCRSIHLDQIVIRLCVLHEVSISLDNLSSADATVPPSEPGSNLLTWHETSVQVSAARGTRPFPATGLLNSHHTTARSEVSGLHSEHWTS